MFLQPRHESKIVELFFFFFFLLKFKNKKSHLWAEIKNGKFQGIRVIFFPCVLAMDDKAF